MPKTIHWLDASDCRVGLPAIESVPAERMEGLIKTIPFLYPLFCFVVSNSLYRTNSSAHMSCQTIMRPQLAKELQIENESRLLVWFNVVFTEVVPESRLFLSFYLSIVRPPRLATACSISEFGESSGDFNRCLSLWVSSQCLIVGHRTCQTGFSSFCFGCWMKHRRLELKAGNRITVEMELLEAKGAS